jgi:hypothetical protein
MERGQTLAREPATSTIWPLVADLSAGGRTEGVTVARALPPTPTSRPTAVRGSLSEGPVASSCRRASTAGRRTLKHGQTFGPTVACDGVIGHAKRGPGPSVVFGSNVPASLQVPTSPTAPSLNAPRSRWPSRRRAIVRTERLQHRIGGCRHIWRPPLRRRRRRRSREETRRPRRGKGHRPSALACQA